MRKARVKGKNKTCMRMKVNGILILLSVLFIIDLSSCHTSKKVTTNTSATDVPFISMERTGCFGKCPIYKVSIYGNGSVVYEGVRYTEKTGKFCGSLTHSQIVSLKALLDSAHLFEMKNEYPGDGRAPADLPACKMTYTQNNQTKAINDHGIESPDKLVSIEAQIDTTVKKVNLHWCDK
jgi:hypothetical protein